MLNIDDSERSFIHEAAAIVRNVELEEMVRGIDYFVTGQAFPFHFDDYKIQCAIKHFSALGVEVHYKAPIKEFSLFKTKAEQTINEFPADITN